MIAAQARKAPMVPSLGSDVSLSETTQQEDPWIR